MLHTRAVVSLVVVLAAALFPSSVRAQAAKRTSTARNVMAGAIVSLDAEAGTIALRPRTGRQADYRLTDKTRCLRQKKTVAPSAFKSGDEVVVRYRKSSVGPPTLYDLADKASWEWLDRVRHDATLVTIREIDDGWLKATEGADGAELEYRFTEKTRWARKGVEAASTDFKPGEKVWVTPRLLPNGAAMAVGVADAPEMAVRLKERSRPTVTGTVKALDLQKRALSLHTAAGDDRSLLLAAECIFRQASKDVPATALKVGQTVTAHVRRDSAGEETVKQVTIQNRKAQPLKPRKT